MPPITVLKSRREECVSAAKLLSDKAKAEDRDLTAAELLQVEKHLEDADSLTREIDAAEGRYHDLNVRGSVGDRLARHNNLGEGVPRAILGNPGRSGPPTGSPFRSIREPLTFGQRVVGGETGRSGFASFGEFLAVTSSGKWDERLHSAGAYATTMTTGKTSSGGALVPVEFRAAFIDAVLERTILVQRATKYAMASDTLNLCGTDGHDHTSRSLYGGITAGWMAEASTMTPENIKTRKITLAAKKLGVLTQSSSELLADGMSWEQVLGDALTESLAWELDYALLRGSGAGQPLGAVNASSTVTVSKESGQTTNTLWLLNLIKMMSRLHPSCWQNAIWIVHPSVVVQLFRLDYHADFGSGSGAAFDTVYQSFREEAGRFFLFGREVFVSEKAAPLGDLGDVVLLDPSKIAFGLRSEIRVEASVHAGFTSDTVYHRCLCRCDASPTWASAVTPASGSDSLSWCVILAERA